MGDGSGLRYQDPNTQKYYFACVIADATACCSQGIEFVPDGDYTYPELDSSITVSGIFDTENRLKYSFQSVFNAVPALHFRDDKVSIAKIRLVPITVSQLKCALHILIGDWYDTYEEGGYRYCRLIST